MSAICTKGMELGTLQLSDMDARHDAGTLSTETDANGCRNQHP